MTSQLRDVLLELVRKPSQAMKEAMKEKGECPPGTAGQCWLRSCSGLQGPALWRVLCDELSFDPEAPRPDWLDPLQGRLPLCVGDSIRSLKAGETVEFHEKVPPGEEDERYTLEWSLGPGEIATVHHVDANGCFILANPRDDKSYPLAPRAALRFVHEESGSVAAPPLPVFTAFHRDFIASHKKTNPQGAECRGNSITRKEEILDIAKDPGNGIPRLQLGERRGGAYSNLTPLEYVASLLRDPQALAGVRHIPAASDDDTSSYNILGKIQRGEKSLFEQGVGSTGFASATTCGFTFQDNVEVMLVSCPGGDQSKYNDVFLACLQDRIGFAVVWEAYFGPAWILVWLRGVLLAVLEGAVPLVLTGAPDISGKKVPGNLGFAQRGEVSLLVALGIEIKHVDIDEFIANRRPNHVLGRRNQWSRLQEALTNPPATKEFLYKLDGRCSTLLHVAIERKAPSPVISQLLDLHPNVSLRDDQGFTALHHAAYFGHSSAVDLLINIPECNVNEKDFEGYSPLCFALLGGHSEIIQSLRDKQAVLTGYEVAVLGRAGVAV